MARSENQKQKLLHLYDILQQKTDEDHPLTTTQLIAELAAKGVAVERKTIYTDLQCLKDYGADIIMVKTNTTGYYLGQRAFQLPELKLLADAVSSSKAITEKKSRELIKKIEGLTSVYQAKQLQRQVYVMGRAKTMNETIYYTIDTIHQAIHTNCQISFRYFDYGLDKQKRFRNQNQSYQVSPYALIWANDNYYLVAHYPRHHKETSHFRVDKMADIQIVAAKRLPAPKGFEPVAYSQKVFSMFSGEEELVTVCFHNSLLGVVLDRFGSDIQLIPKEDSSFIVHLRVAVSNSFFSWLFQFGNQAKILAPAHTVKKLQELLQKIENIYSI